MISYKLELYLLIIINGFLLIINGQYSRYTSDYCYALDKDKLQTAQFATKTPYQVARASEDDVSNRQYTVPDCNPIKFWILSRHGTRLPSTSDITRLRELIDLRDEIINNYNRQRKSNPEEGDLCYDDLMLIKSWSWNPNITGDFDQFLTVQGWDDLKFLAMHYQRIYPNILDNIYSADKYRFRHTKTQRCEASYRGFVEGLFGENAYKYIDLQPIPQNDTLLRPYDYCEKWMEIDRAACDENSEARKFENSKIYNLLIHSVSRRLGFHDDLTAEQIDTIWDMCRFDQSWELNRPSPWCAAFRPEQITILEYLEDLKYFYKNGYGNELINSKVTCSLMSDMLTHFEMDGGSPKTIAYFAHSSTVLLFLTAMGLAKDKLPLKSDNFNQQMNRQWKTSGIGPFATNLAAVKFDCPNSIVEPYKIMFLLNEAPVNLDWCNDGLCDWSDVKRMYRQFYNVDCEKIYCGRASDSLRISLFILYFIPIGYFLIYF